MDWTLISALLRNPESKNNGRTWVSTSLIHWKKLIWRKYEEVCDLFRQVHMHAIITIIMIYKQSFSARLCKDLRLNDWYEEFYLLLGTTGSAFLSLVLPLIGEIIILRDQREPILFDCTIPHNQRFALKIPHNFNYFFQQKPRLHNYPKKELFSKIDWQVQNMQM